MAVLIKQQFISGATDFYTGTNPCRFITVHETGNTSAGADAQAHATYQKNSAHNSNSWHAQADDAEVIESYPDDRMCYHAGDGRGAPGLLDSGNEVSLAIEICQNSDGDFGKACDNAAQWVAIKMDLHDIPMSRLVQHNKWSGKNCPQFLRAGSKGITWSEFVSLVEKYRTGQREEHVEPPTTTGSKEFNMATLAKFTVTRSSKFSERAQTIQALMQARGFYLNYKIDGIIGAGSISEYGKFQVAYNCGTDGRPDYINGAKSWESLITGKKW